MKDKYKTKEQLISELIKLRQKIAELEETETERRRAEESLLESEERYKAIFNRSLYSVYIHDFEGRFIDANKTALNLLGYKIEDIPSVNFSTLLEEDQLPIAFKNMEELLQTGSQKRPIEYKLRKKDGGYVWVKTEGAVIYKQGKPYAIQGIARDITEHKWVEQALLQNEERYRNLVETVPDVIYSFSVEDGIIKSLNPAFEKFTGWSISEWLGRPYMSIIHPDDLPLAMDMVQKICCGETVPPYELRVLSKTGEYLVGEFRSVLEVEKGKIEGIHGIARDITERKRVEEALLESEEKFRAISNTAVDAILVIDNEGKILYWNPAAERMFGYKGDEAMGRELHLFIAPDRYREDYKKGFSKFKKTGQGPAVGVTSEFFALRKDGIEFPIEVATSAIQIRGKWHAVGIVRDITERKLAERALWESEQNYRSLFKESKDVVYVSTPEGKFLDINPAGVELFGYTSKEELLKIDIPCDLYVYPIDREKFQNILAKQGYVKDFEVTFKKKYGEKVTALLTSNLVRDEKDNIVAYRGIIKDITERKHLEEQLLQAQKMEAVGQLAGGVAHDFNNILTVIIGFGNLLQKEVSRDDLLNNYITKILNSAQKAANLTESLLAFSREQIISPRPLNLNEIIQGMERLLSRLISEDIELSTVLTDEHLTVMADGTQMETVLMNLATNARDAMPEGGGLTIRTERIELDHEFIKAHGYGKPGSYALTSIEDTGQGMDEKTKERIFDPFFTTKDVGKGTGLGLAMVYGIIKQHDGYINVYSEPGKGTAFKIYLPLIKSGIEEERPADLPAVTGGTETVLVVEDDALVREFIKKVLTVSGYKVIEAEDGEEALKVFNAHRDKIQLLILDVVMPKKNGKEVYDEIRKVIPDIKAIFTSGYNADVIHKKGILQEGLNYILKPILPQEFLKKVREMLDK